MNGVILGIIMAATVATGVAPLAASPLPVIKDRQLLVDGKPYLAIGGELHNSSASSPAYMEPVWEKLQQMHARTVVSTVTW